ncbi:hypothetical protein BZA05DRAFT_413598 [Tricharina praecox]|uniref:uncharacterized protein n=1 Tax=Tricharina praecox TaxID=43433 RepID=UPI00221E8625|nr:uncharacterized protein BZA05DRAFT_413598 [Tricharina praecox]KAI5840949.1 hypothetical protein BZA05DRAFT_413598 [Tricharina praecox]
MGQWLEATLRGEEMNDVVESDSAERVLWTRFGGELPELQMQESETSIIRHGGRVKDLAALSVEALLAMDSVLKYSSKSKKPVGKGPRGIKPAKHRPSGTWSKAATGSKSATWTKAAAVSWARMAKARAAKAKSDMLSVEKLLVMDNSLWTTAKSSSAKNPTPTAASSTTPRKTPTKRSKASSSAQTATSATTPKKTPAKRSKALSSTPTPTSAATLEQTPASKPTTRSEASSSTPTPTPTPEAAPASPPPTPPPTPPATAKSNPWATVVKTSPKRAAAIKTASIKAAATKGSKGSKAAAAKANKESKAAAKAAAKAAKKPKW